MDRSFSQNFLENLEELLPSADGWTKQGRRTRSYTIISANRYFTAWAKPNVDSMSVVWKTQWALKFKAAIPGCIWVNKSIDFQKFKIDENECGIGEWSEWLDDIDRSKVKELSIDVYLDPPAFELFDKQMGFPYDVLEVSLFVKRTDNNHKEIVTKAEFKVSNTLSGTTANL